MAVEQIEAVAQILHNVKKPLKERFRALFTLRNLGGCVAVTEIAKGFVDSSALLKHECAYCLGQMQDETAIPILTKVLSDVKENAMVRHEAGEALGAIGKDVCVDVLEKYKDDPCKEVAETCQLALDRIRWLQGNQNMPNLSGNPYSSVDPAPPAREENIHKLGSNLVDESLPLFLRYQAMFSLRNIGGKEAVIKLAAGLKCSSALFRHEIAYVLGQIQDAEAESQLKENLCDLAESPMVRHECAEALGAIATNSCMEILQQYAKDQERVVRESCEVALDICDYEQSGDFQYADGLSKTKE